VLETGSGSDNCNDDWNNAGWMTVIGRNVQLCLVDWASKLAEVTLWLMPNDNTTGRSHETMQKKGQNTKPSEPDLRSLRGNGRQVSLHLSEDIDDVHFAATVETSSLWDIEEFTHEAVDRCTTPALT
jgi:hypothetical protein